MLVFIHTHMHIHTEAKLLTRWCIFLIEMLPIVSMHAVPSKQPEDDLK